ncbi:MAG: hypothetical protein JXR76_05370 [Deltaproteobacteria bacterium]|nr:hypothetical protein [Deltaproteobacteria bacterium]
MELPISSFGSPMVMANIEQCKSPYPADTKGVGVTHRILGDINCGEFKRGALEIGRYNYTKQQGVHRLL